jgi:hypothetical protein
MKQLENQVNMLQEELNATKNSIQRNNLSNDNFETSHSNHCSPKQNNHNHSSPAASSNASQIELLRNNEKFYKEKVIFFKFQNTGTTC